MRIDVYRAIFRQECAGRGLAYNDDAVTHLLAAWYDEHGRELRGCHPRDVVEAILDAAQYENVAPDLRPRRSSGFVRRRRRELSREEHGRLRSAA